MNRTLRRVVRTILLNGRINWDTVVPEAFDRWQKALEAWNRYALHRSGISYAMQGYHTGDGISIYADVVETHILIDNYRSDIMRSPEYRRKRRNKRHADEHD